MGEGNGKGPKFKQWPTLERNVQRRGLAERRKELQDRSGYQEWILEQMSVAVRDLYELELEKDDPQVADHLSEIRTMMDQEMYEAEDKTYRDLASAAFALAHVEYFLGQKDAVLIENLRELITTLDGRFLFPTEVRLKQETVRFFGKGYVVRDRLENLPHGQRAIEGLKRLYGVALDNVKRAEEKEIASWRKSADGSARVTLEELLAGKVGRCEAGVAPERPKDGPVRKGGTLFWDGDGESVWIAAAFRGVRDYVERRGLSELKVSVSDIKAPEFSMPRKVHRDYRTRCRRVWELMGRCIKTAQEDAKRDPDTRTAKKRRSPRRTSRRDPVTSTGKGPQPETAQ